MPGHNDDIETRNNWYSFIVKETYFVSFNNDWWQTEQWLSNENTMYVERNKLLNWLDKDVKNAKHAKFKVFFSHKPVFCGYK